VQKELLKIRYPGLSKEQRNDLENVQERATRVMLGPEFPNYDYSLKILGLDGQKLLESSRHRDLLPEPAKTGCNTRHQNKIKPCKPVATNRYRLSFRQYFVSHFNK
jgi:hypothetical protein